MINSNNLGNINLNNNVFKDISLITTNKIDGIYPVKNDSTFSTIAIKDGQIKLTLKVTIDAGIDVVKVCNKLTESVHESIETMTGIDCKTINIDVQGFKKNEDK